MNGKKFILLFCITWDKTFVNKNIGNHLRYLSQSKKYNILYISREKTSFDGIKEINNNIECISLNKQNGVKGEIKYYINLINILFKYNIKLVFWSYLGYPENILFRLFSIPYILKSDSLKSYISKTKNPLKIINSKIKLFFDKKAILTLTETNQNLNLLTELNFSRIAVRPNSIDVKKVKKYILNNKSGYILITGRFAVEKNILDSFKVLNNLIQRGYLFHIHFYGEISDQKYYDECLNYLRMNNCLQYFSFLGFHSKEELWKRINNYKYSINTSLKEGLPNRFLEIMLLNTPILTYNVGYVTEFVDNNNGYIVDVGDYMSITNKIIEFESHPKNYSKCLNSLSKMNFQIFDIENEKILYKFYFNKYLNENIIY
jgi:glycosyltransferase involved in cell wall biosynthesis